MHVESCAGEHSPFWGHIGLRLCLLVVGAVGKFEY